MYLHLLHWGPGDLWDQGVLEGPAKKDKSSCYKVCYGALGGLLKKEAVECFTMGPTSPFSPFSPGGPGSP